MLKLYITWIYYRAIFLNLKRPSLPVISEVTQISIAGRSLDFILFKIRVHSH